MRCVITGDLCGKFCEIERPNIINIAMRLFKKLKFWNNRNVKEDKATQALKKQLEEERRQIYEEERWILQKWMGAKEELEQVKAENEKLRRDYEQEVRAVQQLKDELRQDRRKHLHQVDGLLEDLCKAYTELEEIKAKQSAPNSQPAANAIEPQQGHQDVSEQNLGGGDDEERTPLRLKETRRDLTFINVLGQGAFGTALLARCDSVDYKEDFCAVKVLTKRDVIERKGEEKVMRERDILKLVSGNEHPFVINLNCCFQDEAHLFFVMKLALGGDLRSKLNQEKTFSQELATFYAAEIALALQFLHEKGIVHRDLKPGNILLDKEGHIKVTDFGLSISGLFEGDKTRGLCGTRAYVAPEMAQGLEYKHDVDWWALGIMIYEMLVGSTPFKSHDDFSTLESIVYDYIRCPNWLSEEAVSILGGFLNKDPTRRLVDHDDIKSHAFFADLKWEELEKKQVKPPETKKTVEMNVYDFIRRDLPVRDEDKDKFKDFSWYGTS